jgi:hypothetical protein
MSTRQRLAGLAVVAGTLLVASVIATGSLASAARQGTTPGPIDEDEAVAIAREAYPGTEAQAVESEREGGRLLFEVELSNGVEVEIDAATGEIVETEQGDDDAAGDDEDEAGNLLRSFSARQDATPAGVPTGLAPTVDNPLFPLASTPIKVFEGEEADPDTGETVTLRVEETVRPLPEEVAGTEVTVVEVREFENGELTEETLDYYAQDAEGTVYYLGEKVDKYEDGQIVSHEGEWLAGEGDNQAGIFMPASPEPGQEFEQERAPGIAEDRSTIIALDRSVTTDAGSFDGCMETEDLAPLDNVTETKFYCPDVGLVREEFEGGSLDLVFVAEPR